jgi:hypothetical protein
MHFFFLALIVPWKSPFGPLIVSLSLAVPASATPVMAIAPVRARVTMRVLLSIWCLLVGRG